MSGCASSVSTASRSPCTTLNTPSGKPAPLDDVSQDQRGGRVLLGRLENETVAAGDGVGHHPERHHDREIERGDAGDDTHRLEHRADVDARRDLGVGRPLQEIRDAAGELDILDATCHLAPRVLEHLAVLPGHRGGKLVPTRVEELAEPEEQAGPTGQGGGAPLVRSLDRRRRRRRPPLSGRPGRPRRSGRPGPGRRQAPPGPMRRQWPGRDPVADLPHA